MLLQDLLLNKFWFETFFKMLMTNRKCGAWTLFSFQRRSENVWEPVCEIAKSKKTQNMFFSVYNLEIIHVFILNLPKTINSFYHWEQ